MDIEKLQAIYNAQANTSTKNDIKTMLKTYTSYTQIALRTINNTTKIIATTYTLNDKDAITKKQDGALIEFNKLVASDLNTSGAIEDNYYNFSEDIAKLAQALRTKNTKH